MRGRPELERWGAGGARRAPTRRSSAPAHIRGVLEEVVGHVDRVHEVPPGVDVDEFRPEDRASRARRPARRGGGATRRTPATATSGCPDDGNAERLAELLRERRADRRVLREADREEGRPGAARGDATGSTARLVVVGFGDLSGAARGGRARRARSSPGRSSTATSSTCCRSPTSPSCRRSSRRRSAWSPPRPRPPARRRSSRATRASPRSPPASSRTTRSGFATSPRSTTRRRRRPRASKLASCSRCRRRARGARARRAQRRRRALVVGAASPRGCSRPFRPLSLGFARDGRGADASPGRSCSQAARALRDGTDLHGRRRGGVRAARSRDARARRTGFEESTAAAREHRSRSRTSSAS